MKYDDFIKLQNLDLLSKKTELNNAKDALILFKLMKYINLTGIALYTQKTLQIISDYMISHNIYLQSKKDLFVEATAIIGYIFSISQIKNTLDKKATIETLINLEEQEKSR